MKVDVVRRNNVNISGKGSQPVVFGNGFGCDQNMWRYVAPAFADDFKVVLFDYVGSGGSDLRAYRPERYSSLDGYAQDLLELIEALDLRDVIFVGHSVSSMIGVVAAGKAPERFANLILVGPSPRYINEMPDYVGGFEQAEIEGLLDMMDKNYIGWANSLAPFIMQNSDRPELAQELEESFCSTDPTIARRFAEVTFLSDNRADLAAVKTPTLVMQCSNDAIAPDSVGEYVHQTMPNSTFRHLKAIGHCPHLSHPQETIDVIKAYLAVG